MVWTLNALLNLIPEWDFYFKSFVITVDAVMQEWTAWQSCTVTCGGGTRTRIRHCSAAVNNGKTCPDKSKEENWDLYVQTEPCNHEKENRCPMPLWTAWSATECSVTCGVGTFTKTRHCEDFVSDKRLDPYMHCKVTKDTDLIQTEKCEKPHCPGKFSCFHEWLSQSYTVKNVPQSIY